ncbi:hypothetical protein ACGFNF_29905 [Micromonospora sp. NPDC048868]|uniref:hypothetical protein n=1 Tax=Micromonospora sp. NPDC048868 TaxID=3364258 RepID=UPI00371D3B0D
MPASGSARAFAQVATSSPADPAPAGERSPGAPDGGSRTFLGFGAPPRGRVVGRSSAAI